MLDCLLLALFLTALTTVVHAGCTTAAFALLRWLGARRWTLQSRFGREAALSLLVMLFLLAAALEATLWATAYLVIGAIDQFEPSLYFSVVTYTTLGYGDLTLSETWRLTASLEAGLGILMFGWTTAVLVAVVHRLYNLGDHGLRNAR